MPIIRRLNAVSQLRHHLTVVRDGISSVTQGRGTRRLPAALTGNCQISIVHFCAWNVLFESGGPCVDLAEGSHQSYPRYYLTKYGEMLPSYMADPKSRLIKCQDIFLSNRKRPLVQAQLGHGRTD